MIISDEKKLRQKSELVDSSDEADKIIKKLEQELKMHEGMGLAAPQIGILKQVSIVRYKEYSINIINPIDVDLSSEKFIYTGEGCLSFPGIRKNTVRSKTIQFTNDFGTDVGFFTVDTKHQPYIKDVHDENLVVVIQHEINHLFGKLMFDFVAQQVRLGRNDPCICGSGKKYKKCCIKKEAIHG